jgi:hypothetical protein
MQQRVESFADMRTSIIGRKAPRLDEAFQVTVARRSVDQDGAIVARKRVMALPRTL